ncbi:MAG: ligT [Haloplasmataceae bacterium]|jgi:2'-5' RNA ligase|nr:ligT [Haloplasmataceae bacterium]
MRVFIGIEFDNDVKDYLSEIQNEVKIGATKGNYTLYDNFHLTLRFIGEVSNEDINDLSEVLTTFAAENSSFPIKIGGLNSFNRNNKHIVYVEVLENQEKLKKLAKTIDNGLKELSLKLDDFNFKAHITIAREVVFAQLSILNILRNYDKPILVKKISLMLSSRDKNNILRYTPLFTVNMR